MALITNITFRNVIHFINLKYLQALFLIGTIIAVYSHSLDHQFLASWDDYKYVAQNPDVCGFTFEHLGQSLGSGLTFGHLLITYLYGT